MNKNNYKEKKYILDLYMNACDIMKCFFKNN